MITLDRYQKISALAESMPTQFSKYISFEDADNVWDMACYYNKIQNQYLRDGENEVVKFIEVFDPSINSVRTLGVKASKKYNRDKWLKLLLGEKFFLNLDDLRKFI